MSQPPSLPKLTSFLRPGQQQQPPPSRSDVDDRSGRSSAVDNRLGASPHQQPLYSQDDSRLHDLNRQKRRANIFVQYDDADYQQQQQQQSSVYDRRHSQQLPSHSFPSPHLQSQSPYRSHGRVPPPPMPPPLLEQRRHPPPPPPPSYRSNYIGRSPRDTPPSVPPTDARRVHTVTTEPPPPATAPQEPIQRERKSRYLSEADRRSIIARIDHGEKQVALAKEYQVSRAAICNLYKNRKEVLTRADRDPKPRQTKRVKVAGEEKQAGAEEARGASTIESGAEEKDTSDGHPGDDDAMSDENSSTESVDTDPANGPGSRSPSVATARPPPGPRVYNASNSSYPIRRLVSMIRNAQLSQATLRNVAKRLVSCLIEELLVCLPRRETNVVTSAGDPYSSVVPISDDQICAISLDHEGSLMLPALVDIFPSVATALVSTVRPRDSATAKWSVSCPRLPFIHDNTSVLLLTVDCATGARVAAVIEYLVNFGQIKPTDIHVATIISSQPGIARVHKQFPGVTVVSAAIDDGLDEQGRIRPGIGDLLDRFWHPPSRS